MLYLFVILSLQPNGNSNISQNLLLAGWDSDVDVEFVVVKVISLTMWSTNDILKHGSQPGIGRMRYFAANVDFRCCFCCCHFINLELKLRSHWYWQDEKLMLMFILLLMLLLLFLSMWSTNDIGHILVLAGWDVDVDFCSYCCWCCSCYCYFYQCGT